MLNRTNTKMIPWPTLVAALVALSVASCGGNHTDPKSAEPPVSEEADEAADAVAHDVEGAQESAEAASDVPDGTGTELPEEPEPQEPKPQER